MLIVKSWKATLTDELLKVNSALKPIYSLWSKISAVEGNEVRSEEDGTAKQAHVNLVNKQPTGFRFHQVLRCFRVACCQIWTSSKCLSAPETTTNNQEVKRSLYRLQNVNTLTNYYIFACAWLADLSPSRSTLSVLFNFKNTSIRFYKYQ